ncbi:sulfotransferase domain-containing protein [Singulisphaera sp. GP187]|uniref:sulfotransferase domain-containing protein n=1 Tax=Singulisphaera sp. GP187 TaxID=1882752 RepID=UPI0020B10A6C|nr:sulfotransferase domain-containing protein [Singulisphaera sp. GP187]
MRMLSLFSRIRGKRHENRSNQVRIAVISTPRCGNTWLRLMLNNAYQFDRHDNGELHLYSPFETPWSALPERCVMMTHWHRVEPLISLLKEHEFVVVTLARHPLDVLLSILQYAPCEGSLRWLEGMAGDEWPIFHVSPQSEAFLEYATSPRAQALLAVSAQWWTAPGCHQIRYETLVDNPLQTLTQLAKKLGVAPSVPFEESVEANKLDRLQSTERQRVDAPARHFWQGKPGLWRSLLSADAARRIAEVHHEVFVKLGYSCKPDPGMDDSTATRNWLSLREPNR